MEITENILLIREQIADCCTRIQRAADSVRLVAVSKVKPAAMVEEAFLAGQTIFGESYVQEFCEKAALVKQPVEWHFIGHLQSNKVKYLSGLVSLIHSVDRLSLAREIDRQWGKVGKTANVLIQVNLGEEASKSGTTSQELVSLVRQIAQLKHVRIKGLMALPPWLEEPEEVRPYFRELRELAQEIEALQLPGVEMQELSMGMSHDFAVAIEEGATLVRIGTAIFGERQR